MLNEVFYLDKLKDGQVIKLKEFLVDEHNYYIVTDVYDMNLFWYMQKYSQKITEDNMRDIFEKLVDAVNFCHFYGVLHGDLKPENVLVNVSHEGTIKDLVLCDFGTAISDEIPSNMSNIGTAGYQAPELFQDDSILNHKYDCWSLGVILFNLTTGTMPF